MHLVQTLVHSSTVEVVLVAAGSSIVESAFRTGAVGGSAGMKDLTVLVQPEKRMRDLAGYSPSGVAQGQFEGPAVVVWTG